MSEEAPTKEAASIQTFTPVDQRLFQRRQVFLNGMVNSEMAHRVCRELLALEASDAGSPITLWINSPGGEVTSGFAIYDMVRFISPEVSTIVTGLAASMGSVIALAAEKKNRYCHPNAKFLLHQPLIGGYLQASASDLDIHAQDIIRLKNKMHRLYADRTGTPVEKYVELMERDRWVEPAEAVELGLISGIVAKRPVAV